jgi:hypothetical protein
MRIPGAVAAAERTTAGARARFPDKMDPRGAGLLLLPELRPSFAMAPGEKVFTVGSCFARNVENRLHSQFDIVTREFSVPASEWPVGGRNGILNEYNPGTIAQRITRAVHGTPAPPETVVPQGDKFMDLLLPGPGCAPVTKKRAFERRDEIDAIYAELPTADVIIVTLGLIEAWYDHELDTYLNRMPSRESIVSGRYDLVVMDVDEAIALLEPAFRLLEGKHVLVTVSPVPLNTTFSGKDVVAANAYSKAMLRVCAEQLSTLPGVDYFPSYEMVASAGLRAFKEDNLHVRPDIVQQVVAHMLDSYVATKAIVAEPA